MGSSTVLQSRVSSEYSTLIGDIDAALGAVVVRSSMVPSFCLLI